MNDHWIDVMAVMCLSNSLVMTYTIIKASLNGGAVRVVVNSLGWPEVLGDLIISGTGVVLPLIVLRKRLL